MESRKQKRKCKIGKRICTKTEKQKETVMIIAWENWLPLEG